MIDQHKVEHDCEMGNKLYICVAQLCVQPLSKYYLSIVYAPAF